MGEDSSEQFQQILAALGAASQEKSVVSDSEVISQAVDPILGVVKDLLTKYGPEVREQLEALVDFQVDQDVRALTRYCQAGVSEDHAVQFMVARKSGFQQTIRSTSLKSK